MKAGNWRYILLLMILFSAVGIVSAQDTGTAITQAGQQVQGIAGDFWQRIQIASQNGVMPIILMVGGALMLFIGFRIYNFIITLSGALVGALIAVAVANTTNTLLTTLAMVIGAAVGAFLAIAVYYLAIFAIGAYLGGVLALQVMATVEVPFDPLLVILFGGIMGGIILIGLSFELLVVLSSIVGGQLLALALGLNSYWGLGFIIFGILWQITLAKVLGYKVRRRPTRRMLFRNS